MNEVNQVKLNDSFKDNRCRDNRFVAFNEFQTKSIVLLSGIRFKAAKHANEEPVWIEKQAKRTLMCLIMFSLVAVSY